jgi:hypothetical protein
MTTRTLLEYTDILTLLLCGVVLVAMWRRNALRNFALLATFLAAEIVNQSIQIPIMFFRRYTGISVGAAYNIFFYSHIVIFCIQSLLLMGVIYSVFSLAMRPLVGLHKIGNVIFRWVAGVSVTLAVVFGLGTRLLMAGNASTYEFSTLMGQLQQGVNVLTICLLLFVCFSTKPLGLTYRSHIFGVSLGLGVFSTVQLVQAAWFSTSQAHSLYSPIFLFSQIGVCVAFATWGVYFAVPEPKRGMILLPTTSPYFLWNRISEALGDQPGHVAVSGFKPEMLHPTELMVLTTQSKEARAKQSRTPAQTEAAEAEAMQAGVMSSISQAGASRVPSSGFKTSVIR